jgi:hypothetical protein
VNSFSPHRFDNFLKTQGGKMDSAIRDLALDLGVFALDNEIENRRTIDPFLSADKSEMTSVKS